MNNATPHGSINGGPTAEGRGATADPAKATDTVRLPDATGTRVVRDGTGYTGNGTSTDGGVTERITQEHVVERGAVATGWASTFGAIRAQELERGSIDHALDLVVPCVHGGQDDPSDPKGFVAPAQGGDGSRATVGLRGSNLTAAPKEGQRYRLNMTDAEIMALDVPDWKKTILRALATYGALVSDTSFYACADGRAPIANVSPPTCADKSRPKSPGWGFEVESGVQYTSLGQQDPFVAFAKRVGLPSSDALPYAKDGNPAGNRVAEYTLGFGGDAVPWASRLQLLKDPLQ